MARRLGKVSFQSNDKSDVFLVSEVWEHGVEVSDETLVNIFDVQFEGDRAWVTGKVPSMTPVNINGDTSIIHAWFKGEEYADAYYLKVYLECEVSEELEEVELELTQAQQEEKERIAQENLIKEKLQREIDARSSASTGTDEHFY